MPTTSLGNGHVMLTDGVPGNPIIFEAGGTTYYAFSDLAFLDGFDGGAFKDRSGCIGINEWRFRNIQLQSAGGPLQLAPNNLDFRAFDAANPSQEVRTIYTGQVKLTWEQLKATLFLPVPSYQPNESVVQVRVVNKFVPSLTTTTITSVQEGTMTTRFPYPSASGQIQIETVTLGDPTIDNQNQQTYLVGNVTLDVS